MVPLRYIYKSLAQRKARTLMTLLGVALVIGIYAAMSAVAATMTRSFQSTGAPQELVILQAGALAVDVSTVERETLTFVQTLDGVAQQGERPLVSPELRLAIVTQHAGEEHDLSVRGVTDIAPHVYSQIRLSDGSWPSSGHRAAIGRALANKLDLGIGGTIEFDGERWEVVGIHDSSGRVYDQEIWVDLDDLAAAENRRTYTSYTLLTENASAATALCETINNSRRFPLRAQTAPDFYAAAGTMSTIMAGMGQFIAIVIALAAALGGMNTMYSAVASRRREIGVLRALGFKRSAVLFAFVLESVLLCFAGGLLGILFGLSLSFVPFNVPYLPASSVVLGLEQAVSALVLSVVVGLIGGGLPALQAARIKIVDALR